MLKKQTEIKLKKMNMGAVIDAARAMEGQGELLSKEEWLEILVDRLYDVKCETRLANLVRQAHLPIAHACIQDLITDADRMLDIGLIDRLVSGEYITKHHDVVVMGAAGAGKTWIASCLGLSACKQYLRVEYLCTQDLVDELLVLRTNPQGHAKRIKQLSNVSVLIIDDWLSKETDVDALDELFCVIDKRSRSLKSTIFCSQFLMEGWAKRMGGYPEAESIVDRVKNNSYKIELKGETSMRERCIPEELKINA